jgi:hypothetical protein
VTAGRAINVRSLANSLLDAVVAHWQSAEGAPLPTRRYVAPGVPSAVAWDCEQLTVSLAGVGWGPAIDSSPVSPRGGTPTSVSSVRHAMFMVSLVRCTPVPNAKGTPPSAADLQASGDQFMLDAGLLSQALVRWRSKTAGQLPEDGHSMVQLGVIEPAGPSGKYVSVEGSAIITAAGLEVA